MVAGVRTGFSEEITFLTSLPYCKKVEFSNVQPGDMGLVRSSPKNEAKKKIVEIHGFTVIHPTIGFGKSGNMPSDPFMFWDLEHIKEYYFPQNMDPSLCTEREGCQDSRLEFLRCNPAQDWKELRLNPTIAASWQKIDFWERAALMPAALGLKSFSSLDFKIILSEAGSVIREIDGLPKSAEKKRLWQIFRLRLNGIVGTLHSSDRPEVQEVKDLVLQLN